MSDSTDSTTTVTATDSSAEAAASTDTKSPSGTADSFTTVNNMSELKTKAPEVYKAMMQGLATNICNEMKASQDRIKEMNRKFREDTGQT